jgi:hypothetical protein
MRSSLSLWSGLYRYKNIIPCIVFLNSLNAELNPICHLLALLVGATIVVVSRLRVKVKGLDNTHDAKSYVKFRAAGESIIFKQVLYTFRSSGLFH